jgi:ketosteroid isomerase-like protein
MLMSSTASSFFSSKPLPLHRIPTLSRPQLISTQHANIFTSSSKAWATKTTIKASSSENQTVTVAPSVESASDVVRSFYEGINGHDLDSVEELIAENCVYEDLIFPRPFVGRKVLTTYRLLISSLSFLHARVSHVLMLDFNNRGRVSHVYHEEAVELARLAVRFKTLFLD